MSPRRAGSPPGPRLDQYSDEGNALQLQAVRDHHGPAAVTSTRLPLPSLRHQSPASSQVLPSTTTHGLLFKSARPCLGTALGVTPQQHTSSHWQSTYQCPACVGRLDPPASPTSLRAGPLAAQMQPHTCPSSPPGRPGPAPPAAPTLQSPKGLKARVGCCIHADCEGNDGHGGHGPQEPQGPRPEARTSC
ncbi:hypothetical protein NDU88_002947 [Pleurodeles waltl]|uniref:Uncharacterized protein n=1 Tax=Pleurodeles waltl TaxID=8319 RepID=A0AAV7SC03_PLEWA|nr:hypothetical protein NDU88_002947 [Pleurodeles waltl]